MQMQRKSNREIAMTILEQMGGARRIRAMIGAWFSYLPNGIGIRWPSRTPTKGNYVEVIYQPGMDSYDMTFYAIPDRMLKGIPKFTPFVEPPSNKGAVVKKFDDIYFDQLVDLFENQTGWLLRLGSQKTASQLMPSFQNTYYKVISPFQVWEHVGSVPTENYYGTSKLYGGVYQARIAQKGDEIHATHGGVFLVPQRSAVGFPVEILLSEKGAFGKTYKDDPWPLNKMKLIPEGDEQRTTYKGNPKKFFNPEEVESYKPGSMTHIVRTAHEVGKGSAQTVAARYLQAAQVSDFTNKKILALARKVMGHLKQMKASWDDKPDLPSNVGGFIKHLFGYVTGMTARDNLHLLFGNYPDMGSGMGVDDDLAALARTLRGLTEAEAAALSVVLIKSVRRPKAALLFERWVSNHIDLSKYTPGEGGANLPTPSEVFDTKAEEWVSKAKKVFAEVGKAGVFAFAYDLAEDINWHRLNSTGLLGGGGGLSDKAQQMESGIAKETSWSFEPASGFIYSLLRLAGEQRAALAVKKFTLSEYADSFRGF